MFLTAHNASVRAAQNASTPSLIPQDNSGGPAGDWISYFNGVFGGFCLALLIVMLVLIPFVPWEKFEKKRNPFDWLTLEKKNRGMND